jgi:hypothetical protein
MDRGGLGSGGRICGDHYPAVDPLGTRWQISQASEEAAATCGQPYPGGTIVHILFRGRTPGKYGAERGDQRAHRGD